MCKRVINKIKKYGIITSLKIARDRAVRPFIASYYEKKWSLMSKQKGFYGVTDTPRKEQLIVSLTTFPARIDGIHYVIETLLMQTVKPDKVILWLANDQFPDRKLPENLTCLERYGLTISWCRDLRSYKKLIPTLLNYPDAVIITADDDMYYHSKMVERLYKAYLKESNYIHCHRVTKFVMKDDKFATVAGGYDIYPHPSYLHKLTGGSGCCYPPHSLYKDITDDSLFMTLAPTNDDIWFWLMAAMNGMRCNVVKHSCTALYFVKGSQSESLNSINDKGEKLFWKQFQNMLDYYPQIEPLLIKEWEREKKL